MKPAIQLADQEWRTGILPADSAAIELERPTLFWWTILAGLSLLVGVTWRVTGHTPPVPQVLDGVNLALWLTAPWLALSWDRLLRRQHRHIRPLRDPWAWRLANSSYLLFAALLLSVAPAALALGFNLKEQVARFYLVEDMSFVLPTGVWLLMSLVLVGPITVVTSVVLLHLARVIVGWRWGLACWLMLTVACNAPLALGSGPFLILPSEGVRLPFTMGQYAIWAAMQVAASQAEAVYLHQMIGRLIILPCGLLLVALIIATVFQWPVRRPTTRVDAIWLVAVAAVSAVAARAAWQGWLWVGDPSRTAPGDWLALFYTGMAAAWLVWCLLLLLRVDFDRMAAWRVFGWLAYSAGAWFSLTLLHRFAAQAETTALLVADAAAFLFLLAGLLLLFRVARIRVWRSPNIRSALLVLVLAGLVLPVPLGGHQAPLVFQGFNLLVGNLSATSTTYAYYVLLALLLLCAVLWPYTARRQPRAAE